MKCAMCGHKTLVPGTTTIPLERGEFLLVMRDVPALVCENCGEEFVEEKTTALLLKEAEDVFASGVKIEIRSFAA